MSNAWLESSAHALLRMAETTPYVDKLHVTECMMDGWKLTNTPASFFGSKFQPGVYQEQKDPNDIASRSQLIAAVQTSAWFELDGDMYQSSMEGGDPPTEVELPPLPFKRTLFQNRGMADNRPHLLLGLGEDYNSPGNYLGCPLMVVYEIEQGSRWDVLSYFFAEEGHWLPVYRFGPKGMVEDYAPGWDADELDKEMANTIWKCAVTCAHIVTASNVMLLPGLTHRKERRNLQRLRYAPTTAKQYKVTMSHTINVSSVTGTSDREYHCRWLVRGHWRNLGERRVWVKSHIKGPIGAPWKGRPIHTSLKG